MRWRWFVSGALGWAALLAAIPPRPAGADVFLLKDGTRHEGTAVPEGEALVITTFEGKVLRVKKDEVVGTTPQPELNEYHRRARQLKPDDAVGHYELGKWAQAQTKRQTELAELAKEQFRQVLTADPLHEGAGKALGYALKNGRWAPKDEDTLVIGPKHSATRDPKAEADEARKLAKQLEGLGGTGADQREELKALIDLARERPEVFAAILKSPGRPGSANIQDGAIRAKAADILGEGGDRRALQPLLDACFEDLDDRARFSAAKALARLEEPIALRKLVDVAVGKFPWLTRKLACIAIRRYSDKEAIELLLREVSFELAGGHPTDPKNKLRAGPNTVGTENPLGLPTEQPALLPQDETILYPALSALKEVTGAAFDSGEKDFKTWKEWWKKTEAAFKFRD